MDHRTQKIVHLQIVVYQNVLQKKEIEVYLVYQDYKDQKVFKVLPEVKDYPDLQV